MSAPSVYSFLCIHYWVFVKASLTALITREVVEWMYHAEQKLFTSQNSINAKLERKKNISVSIWHIHIYTFFFNFVKPFQKDFYIALLFFVTPKKKVAAQKNRVSFSLIFLKSNLNSRSACDMSLTVTVISDIFFLYCIHGWDHCVLNYISITIKEDNC